MRGMALEEELEAACDAVERTGGTLLKVLVEITEDGVITTLESARMMLAIQDHNQAIDRQRPVVNETAGTLDLIGTAVKAGIRSAWLDRRVSEHGRDMAAQLNN